MTWPPSSRPTPADHPHTANTRRTDTRDARSPHSPSPSKPNGDLPHRLPRRQPTNPDTLRAPVQPTPTGAQIHPHHQPQAQRTPATPPTTDAAPADHDPTAAQNPNPTPTPTPSIHEHCNQPLNPKRLRRAGSESRGVALSGCSFRWVVGSGRVLPSPVPGGNQGSAGSATGGGLAGCCLLSSPVALPAEPWSGFAGQAKGAPDLEGIFCAALRARPALTAPDGESARRVCAALRLRSVLTAPDGGSACDAPSRVETYFSLWSPRRPGTRPGDARATTTSEADCTRDTCSAGRGRRGRCVGRGWLVSCAGI